MITMDHTLTQAGQLLQLEDEHVAHNLPAGCCGSQTDPARCSPTPMVSSTWISSRRIRLPPSRHRHPGSRRWRRNNPGVLRGSSRAFITISWLLLPENMRVDQQGRDGDADERRRGAARSRSKSLAVGLRGQGCARWSGCDHRCLRQFPRSIRRRSSGFPTIRSSNDHFGPYTPGFISVPYGDLEGAPVSLMILSQSCWSRSRVDQAFASLRPAMAGVRR